MYPKLLPRWLDGFSRYFTRVQAVSFLSKVTSDVYLGLLLVHWLQGHFGTVVADVAASVADAVADSVFPIADLTDYLMERSLFISYH